MDKRLICHLILEPVKSGKAYLKISTIGDGTIADYLEIVWVDENDKPIQTVNISLR